MRTGRGRGIVWHSVCVLLFTAVWTSWAPTAPAQTSVGRVLNAPAQIEALRERQSELFQALIDKPDDLDLMFEYAVLSIQLEDYEAAISTLERMLIYRQDLPRVRLELAVAYFSLGSYEVADLYFDQVLDDPGTPPDVRARIARYKEAIEERTRRTALTGLVTVGVTYSTNATLGPDGDQVIRNVLGGATLFTVDEGRKEDGAGIRQIISLRHVYDLEQEDADVWLTDATAFSVRYFDETEGNVDFFNLRTGPRLSLDRQQFGPKVRPYIEAQYLTSNERGLFAGYGAGFELSNTVGPVLSLFSDTGFRYRNYFRQEFTDQDTFNFYTNVGIAYIPTRDLVLRATLLGESDRADEDFNSNVETGLRLSGEYQYDSGIAWIDRKWSFSGFGEFRYRRFRSPDPDVPGGARRDFDYRGGLTHVFALQDGFGIQLDVEGLLRRSNILNFDLSNFSTTLSAQFRF